MGGFSGSGVVLLQGAPPPPLKDGGVSSQWTSAFYGRTLGLLWLPLSSKDAPEPRRADGRSLGPDVSGRRRDVPTERKLFILDTT